MIDPDRIAQTVAFHGHMCPGLALGIRAAEVALVEIGSHSPDEEVVAIVETDMCGVDAIQFLTGCTFGKGNLVHRDHGKNAYTFIRRSDGAAVRVNTKPGAWNHRPPGWHDQLDRVRTGVASDQERQQFQSQMLEKSYEVLARPIEDLYAVRPVVVEAPWPARIHRSIDCASCGEPTMETRIRRLNSREFCLPCFKEALRGTVPVSLNSRPTPD